MASSFDEVGPSNRRLCTRQLRGQRSLSRPSTRRRARRTSWRRRWRLARASRAACPAPRAPSLSRRLRRRRRRLTDLAALDRFRRGPRGVLSRRVDRRQLVPKRSKLVVEALDLRLGVGEVTGGVWEILRQEFELGACPSRLRLVAATCRLELGGDLGGASLARRRARARRTPGVSERLRGRRRGGSSPREAFPTRRRLPARLVPRRTRVW